MITRLYRYYDNKGGLLYVGTSYDSFHRGGATWHKLISKIEVDVFSSKEKALQAEQRIIKREKPPYNITTEVTNMTADEYRAALALLGLSQGQAAKVLGVSVRSSNGYANGAPIPKPCARLLQLLLARQHENLQA